MSDAPNTPPSPRTDLPLLPSRLPADGEHAGVCNLCEATCGLRITVAGGAVTAVRGEPSDPLSRGYVCPKGVSLADVYADPDRLTVPLRRTADGWEEMAWDDAVELVAQRLAGTIRDHGRNAVATYTGNPSAHSLGALTHGLVLHRALRTQQRFSASSVDQVPHQLVTHLLYGHQLLVPVPDLDRTDHLLVIGGNPMASNGSMMTAPDFPNRMRALRARGGRLVVIDPRRTETARIADEHHFVRPGTDAALVLAMLHVLLHEADTAPALPEWMDGLEEVRALVAPVTPDLAASVTGVPADVVRRLALDLAAAPRAVVYGRLGVSTQRFGTLTQWGIQLLNIVTGNLDREGGSMFTEPAADIVGMGVIGAGSVGRWTSRVRGVPEFAGELPSAVMREEIETPGEGQVRALVTMAGNPVLSTPEGHRLAEALDGLDFMVSIDVYLNETTRHADVILPPTSALERDQYDLLFHALAVRNTARFVPALAEPGPDQRHDWWIFSRLGTRIAELLDEPLSGQAALTASVTPRDVVALLLQQTGRTTLEALLAEPAGVDLGPLRPVLPERLQTPDRRVALVPALVREEVARFAAWSEEAAGAPTGEELLLIGRRHQRDCNSWLHNTTRLTRGRPRHHLLMHPDDLTRRGLQDGARVRVTSRVGSVEVEVSATDDVMPGVVSLPHGYGHGVAGVRLRVAAEVPGVSINDLTDTAALDVSGNAALSAVPVTVAAAG
ncbi:molybdopterin-dependent oxidoreductase [Nocardioides sp.]|uniref:molybdopterin-dependent oxidoreductase n=1 Tax=Nocardioides sp. TaxID=35761 RepID=UPI0035126D8A